jgi:hypothetical protein
MISVPTPQNPETVELSGFLTYLLTQTTSLNSYMGTILPVLGGIFGTQRISLVDYYENTDHFDLLFFDGYPSNARHSLQRRLTEMEVRRALEETRPFHSDRNPNFLIIPCYFRDILEALIACEGDFPIELTPARQECALLISRFLGLFMSSVRLEVNRAQVVDSQDLQRARQIQLNFLPKHPPRTHRCEVYGVNQSSNLVGGDYFDYFDEEENVVQCILADACGHGMAAALIMSNFRGLLRSEVLRRQGLEGLFSSLNDMIHFDDDLIQYLTCVFLQVEEPTGRLDYLNAGHYEPVVISADGDVRTLPGGGPPLGMFKSSRYPVGQAQLHSGDLVALYTDGLLDVQNRRDEYFGEDRVIESLKRNRGLQLDEITRRVMEEASDFADGRNFEDDITVFVLRLR